MTQSRRSPLTRRRDIWRHLCPRIPPIDLVDRRAGTVKKVVQEAVLTIADEAQKVMNKSILRVIFSVFLWSNLSIASTLPDPPQQFATFSECHLISGQVIAPCRIGYRTYGTLNADKSNAVLVPTWFTGTSADHAYLASPEILNPEKYLIVIVDALGNGVSISPSNSKTQPHGQFPQIAITDMVESQHRLLTEVLGVHSLHGVVGLSMGGFATLHFGLRHAARALSLVVAGCGYGAARETRDKFKLEVDDDFDATVAILATVAIDQKFFESND